MIDDDDVSDTLDDTTRAAVLGSSCDANIDTELQYEE
jgi:hypothetical protein